MRVENVRKALENTPARVRRPFRRLKKLHHVQSVVTKDEWVSDRSARGGVSRYGGTPKGHTSYPEGLTLEITASKKVDGDVQIEMQHIYYELTKLNK